MEEYRVERAREKLVEVVVVWGRVEGWYWWFVFLL